MKTITKERHILLLKNNCDKGKHRLRTNKFGVIWCILCGVVSNAMADKLNEEDKLLIK